MVPLKADRTVNRIVHEYTNFYGFPLNLKLSHLGMNIQRANCIQLDYSVHAVGPCGLTVLITVLIIIVRSGPDCAVIVGKENIRNGTVPFKFVTHVLLCRYVTKKPFGVATGVQG